MARLLICAGGTGGGVYPAMVVRQALAHDADPILWVGSEGGMEADLVQRAGIPFTTIPSGQIAGMGLRTLPNLVRVFQGMLASRHILKNFKPDVLLFTGGYVAVPMALAGRTIPSLVYVPDTEPGLALKLLARFASVIAVTTEESLRFFSPESRVVVTGYPTRPDLTDWTREKAQLHLGLVPDRFTLLVTGGSKGARTLNLPFLSMAADLLNEMQIIHITGQLDWAEVEAFRSSLTPELAQHYHIMPYLHEMGAALASADLVVSRAGASTLGEYPLFGLPAILVPYQYAWRYQKRNADYLVQHGAAVMLTADQVQSDLLQTIKSLSNSRERLEAMRHAMFSLARPQAADRLANLVRELAGEHGVAEDRPSHTGKPSREQ